MSEWHFYIAHAEPDGERATQLAEALARHRWRVYVPGVSADAGTDRQAADESALRAARICVVLVSPQSQADASLRATVMTALEYRQADPHERRVVPVLLDGLKPRALRQHLGLGNVTPLQAEAAAVVSMAGVAAKLDDLARRMKLDDPTAEADRPRVAIVAVEEELGTASRHAFEAIDPIGRVSVEQLDAAQADTSGRLDGFDFVVGLLGARLGQPGLFQGLVGREDRAVLRLKDVNIKAILRAERDEVLDLHERIDDRDAFTSAESAARLAHARVVAWQQQRFPTPPGGQALIEPWERDYLTTKLNEWASVRYAPLAVKAGERELRREALYVSLYAAPQTWCYVVKGGGLVVKSPRQERATQSNPKSPLAEEDAGERQPPSGEDSDRRPFLETALSHPDLKALVLEGEGGSGKSVLLQHVAHVLAAKHLGLPAPEHHLDFGALHAGAPLLRIPVLLEARRIAQEIHAHGPERALREAVTAVFGGVDVLEPTTVLEGLNRGRYLLLVDALDEVPGVAMREKVLHALASQAALGGPLRLVLTTRPTAYTGVVVPAPLRVLSLAPMNKSDARRLIERWTHAQGRASDYRKKLLRAVSGVRRTHRIRNVLENPLLLTCLLLVYEQHRRLPNSTAELYERMVEVLCLSKATRERGAGDVLAVSDQDRREALEWIGLGLQEHGGTARPLPAVVVDLCKQRPDLSPTAGDGEELVKRLALETALTPRLGLH